MKKLIDDPSTLLDEALTGLARAHPALVVESDPRVVRRVDAPVPGKVGLVSGGGSGHEPLHVGFVGRGMLDAACPGAIFTSPTPDQIVAATRAVEAGRGVLHIVKNYTGDVMNFDLAAEMAEAEGIRVGRVLVDDDVAVRDSTYTVGRRGVAGTVLVEKVCGAAAEAGAGLEELVALGARVVADTKTMGVALSSCTVPHVGRPTFDLGDDEMELGVGIHGEPGRARLPLEPASAVVARLVAPVAEELGLARGERVVLLVNGLGATPLLELYGLAAHVERELARIGVEIARALVGNYVTSLDMAGASVTLSRVDEERLSLFDAPADTPGLSVGCGAVAEPAGAAGSERGPGHASLGGSDRTGRAAAGSPRLPASVAPERHLAAPGTEPSEGTRSGSEPGGAATHGLVDAVRRFAAAVHAERDHLSALDAAIGDGDHGANLDRGLAAALAALDANPPGTPAAVLGLVGRELVRRVGGASGVLYGTAFQRAAAAVGERPDVDPEAMVAGLEAALAGIEARGGAEVGDKTMVDAWVPAVEAARAALGEGGDIGAVLAAAAEAAAAGAARAVPLVARKGRASYVGERSAGHADPGATSSVLLFRSLSDAFGGSGEPEDDPSGADPARGGGGRPS